MCPFAVGTIGHACVMYNGQMIDHFLSAHQRHAVRMVGKLFDHLIIFDGHQESLVSVVLHRVGNLKITGGSPTHHNAYRLEAEALCDHTTREFTIKLIKLKTPTPGRTGCRAVQNGGLLELAAKHGNGDLLIVGGTLGCCDGHREGYLS